MRFLLDESADLRLRPYLTQRGHDVTSIARDHAQALDDRQVLAIAHRERRILIAGDRDFSELIVRQGLPHAGVILFRLKAPDLNAKIAWLDHLLLAYADRRDRLLIISHGGLRIR